MLHNSDRLISLVYHSGSEAALQTWIGYARVPFSRAVGYSGREARIDDLLISHFEHLGMNLVRDQAA